MSWLDALEDLNRPQIEPKPWMKEKVLELVTDETKLQEVVDSCIQSQIFSLDLETTGLDNRVFYGDNGTPYTIDKIVGYCLSPDGHHGYYIPVRHVDAQGVRHDSNLSPSVVAQELRRLVASGAKAIFHNGKFDQEFLQFGEGEPIGEWDDPDVWEDTLILAYLRNTRERSKGLKFLALQELGMEMIELDELFSVEQKKQLGNGNLNFSLLDPTWEPCIWYAASDAICTFLLYAGTQKQGGDFPGLYEQVMDPKPHGQSQKVIYKLEKLCLPSTRWMERNRIYIDRDKVKELISLGQQEWFESLADVYNEARSMLGRDIRPGWLRIMQGDEGAPPYDPTQVQPTYMECREEALREAARRRLDPMEAGPTGRERVETIVKDVPSLLNRKKQEQISFPRIYDVTIPSEFGLLLRELGVQGLEVTAKSGQIKTSKDVLEKLLESQAEDFPFMAKVRRFREVAKALGSNLFPILKDTEPRNAPDSCLRVAFNGHKVDTGRFATPTPRDKKGFHGQSRWNLHSIPATYDTKKPACMLRIREAVKARPGHLLFACVAEGSLIQTQRGLVPIEEVVAGDSVITEHGLEPVTRASKTGHREVVRIISHKGYSVRVTPDHLVWTVAPEGLVWKEAGSLLPHDWVVSIGDAPIAGDSFPLPPTPTCSNKEQPIRTPVRIDPSLSEFLGRFMGDGCIGHDKGKIRYVGFSLGLDEESVLPGLNAYSERAFGRVFTSKGRGDVHCSSQPLGRWLESVTHKGSLSVEEYHVPEAVLRSPAPIWSAFLRGLFDADGSVGSRPGDGVRLWITSERMASEVQIMLLGLGIPSRRNFEIRETNYGHHEGWALTITGIRSLEVFHRVVGMGSPRKKAELDQLLASGRNRDISNFIPLDLARKAVRKQSHQETNACIRNGRRKGRVSYRSLEACAEHPTDIREEWMSRLLKGNLLFDTVKSVEPDGHADVYDLTVPSTGYFCANGITVHNCDFSGVELRIVTNLAREPKWLAEFFHCSSCDHTFDAGDGRETPEAPPPFCPKCGSDKIGDLHTLTALSVYGEGIKDTKEFKQKRQNAKCVHPDTLIRTRSGRVRIGTLDFGEDDTFHPVSGIEVLNPERQYVRIKETYNGGVKPLCHVVTRRGVLTCSYVHRFALADGTLKSVETGLAPGDILPEPVGDVEDSREFPTILYRPFKGVPVLSYRTDAHTAYFAGLHAGDGCSSESCAEITHGPVGGIDQTGTSYEEWQSIIMDACRSAGLEPKAKTKKVYLGSRHVLRWMEILGLVEGTPPTRRTFRVPSWVLEAGRLAMLHYLGGLMDTDGTVSVNGDISITTKDLVFAGQIAELFRAVGCTASVGTSWNETYQRHYLRVSVKRRDGSILRPFMRHPGKTARISDTEVGYDRWDNEVLHVIPAGEGWCVDLHIDSDDHLYMANGLAVHNSLNFAMCYGGGPSAAQRAVGVDRDEGFRIKRQFDKSYGGLTTWWRQQHAFARKYKYVTTLFGRRYPLPDIDHEMGGFRSKAERNAVNGPVQGCLHPDVRIPTSRGLVPIQDLYRDAQAFMVWTGQGWREARPLYSGDKPVRVTEFSPGTTIKTSPEHLFLTWRDQTDSPQGQGDVLEWVRQQNLGAGDWVAMSTEALEWGEPQYQWASANQPQEGHLFPNGMTPHNYKGFTINGNSEAMWEFLGLVYGDGSIGPDRFTLHVGEPSIEGYTGPSAEEIARTYMEKINGNLDVGASTYHKQRPEGESHKKDTWQVQVRNKAFRDFCREVLGVQDQNTYTKRFPASLWKESIKNRAAFLRGYFSSDGHVSASGDAVSVRSVNLGLLRDTHDLLRSIGIRSSYREKSLRVSILDRNKYADMVGFTLPYKTSRLASRKKNSWENQWDTAPPNLVRWVGRVVRSSSVYADLPREEKSAVIRLEAGSGSRYQCQQYLDKIDKSEVPESLVGLLRYDWEQVVSTKDTGETVEMYDVEVFDDFHAFVADGCVVHNTSADITKLSMALIYKECKDRGWLDLVKMTITIHDELVFEIHKSIVEEAVEVICHLMTKNKFMMRMRCPIPLKVDTEFGQDWTVPYNLTEMAHNQSKKPWTPEFARLFPKSYANYLKCGGEPVEGVEPTETPPPNKGTPVEQALAIASQSKEQFEPPKVTPKQPYRHVVHSSKLSYGVMEKLAHLIMKCEGRGTQPLHLVTEDGDPLLPLETPILVSATEFKILAGQQGL